MLSRNYLAAVMICVCTVSLSRVFISPLEPGNCKTTDCNGTAKMTVHAGVRTKNSNASPTPFAPLYLNNAQYPWLPVNTFKCARVA